MYTKRARNVPFGITTYRNVCRSVRAHTFTYIIQFCCQLIHLARMLNNSSTNQSKLLWLAQAIIVIHIIVHFCYTLKNAKQNQTMTKWKAFATLTDCAHRGKYQVDPTSRCVCKTPFTTWRSITSVPITAGFIGFGYFLHAACATVSHLWLQ